MILDEIYEKGPNTKVHKGGHDAKVIAISSLLYRYI